MAVQTLDGVASESVVITFAVTEAATEPQPAEPEPTEPGPNSLSPLLPRRPAILNRAILNRVKNRPQAMTQTATALTMTVLEAQQKSLFRASR